MPSNKKLLQAAAGSAGGDNLYVEDVFSTFLYEGTGSSLAINNGLDLSGEGGLMWLKGRDGAYYHKWYDTERGIQYAIESNTTDANQTEAQGVTAVGSSGFTLGTDGNTNSNGADMASWSFRKAAGFFDIVTYTGNGTAGRTVAHNLGSVPKMMLIKRTSASGDDWAVYHSSLGATKLIALNTTSAAVTNPWLTDTTPTDSVFTLNNYGFINASGSSYVAYLFGDDAIFGEGGDEQICKIGSFSTTGNSTITLGFEPQWLMVKQTNGAAGWYIWDTMRGWTVGASGSNNDPSLYADTSGAEVGYNVSIGNPTATGFVLENYASGDYIYMAIRRPMKVPEAGTEVFAVNEGTPGFTTGFPVDFNMNGATSGGYSRYALSRLTGNLVAPYLDSAATLAGSGSIMFTNGNANTVIDLATNWFAGASDIISWSFKRAPQFMDVVAYTGNGTAGTTQAHNLTVVPEFIIWKNITGTNDSWISYWSTLGVGNYLLGFNTTTASGTGSIVNSTAPTASVITLSGQGWNVNNSGSNYIACLFATLAGISKVGSVVHSGTTNVDCGFSAGARFVLVRRTDASGGWYVWDSVRGIVSGNDPYLLLNSTAAEVTNTDYIDPLASGFTLTSSFTAGTYIFLAIA